MWISRDSVSVPLNGPTPFGRIAESEASRLGTDERIDGHC